MLFDAHTHLNYEEFSEEERLDRAKEIEESARIDGCSEIKILFKMVIPNSKAILFVVAIFMFVWTWNDYFGPAIFLNDEPKYTLAVGLIFLNSSISGYKDALDQGPVMAMALLTVHILY